MLTAILYIYLCTAVARMLYWSVGGDSTSARYIHRTSLDGATAADNIEQFTDVTDSSISSDDEVAAAVQDIVVDVRTRRYTLITQLMNPIQSYIGLLMSHFYFVPCSCL